MAIAHIVIQIIESEDGTDHHLNVSYSGGSDLTKQESQADFASILQSIEKLLTSKQDNL